MNFCPHCRFMVYTKLESGSNQLRNYCKNCDWSEEIQDTTKSVYQRHYQEDFIADKVISNKYTIFDPTLPRVAYDCINENCATNYSHENKHLVVLQNLPANKTDDEVKNFLETSGLFKDWKRMKLTSALLELDSEQQKNEWSGKSLSLDEKNIKIVEFQPAKKEVLYIKYDSINMKYLYICAVCGTSWKKN